MSCLRSKQHAARGRGERRVEELLVGKTFIIWWLPEQAARLLTLFFIIIFVLVKYLDFVCVCVCVCVCVYIYIYIYTASKVKKKTYYL